ncbi:MAG: translation initiation factor IF-3 [Verrucomicrobiales bacterium]|nr:translation initiation factor IF-3 [Verrucomicrobiales bacterium]
MPRINGKIRAREVRVIGPDGKQVGILPLNEALAMARAHGVDLVEVAPNATPPVCRLVDYGKFRYEQAKKEKESRKHQHANQVKEIQLSPRIDPHDLKIKVGHAIDFLCDDIKVKLALKFRGREMAHTEFGFDVVKKFLDAIAPYGHADFEPKLVGRGIHVMISPLPRNKRARNPRELEREAANPTAPAAPPPPRPVAPPPPAPPSPPSPAPAGVQSQRTFGHNPFADLRLPGTDAPVETHNQ